MASHEFEDLAVLGLVAEGGGCAETIYDQLQTELDQNQSISYMKCTSLLLRFSEEDYVIGCDKPSSDTASRKTQANKKDYTITQSGRNYLRSLLQSPIKEITDPVHQFQLLTKIRFLHHLPKGKQDEQLAQLEDQLYQARNNVIENDTTEKKKKKTINTANITKQLLTSELEF